MRGYIKAGTVESFKELAKEFPIKDSEFWSERDMVDYPYIEIREGIIVNGNKFKPIGLRPYPRTVSNKTVTEKIKGRSFISSFSDECIRFPSENKQTTNKQERTMVYQVVATKKATVHEQKDGKGDTLIHKVETVVANSEAAAIALYTQQYLAEVDVANLEVIVRNF